MNMLLLRSGGVFYNMAKIQVISMLKVNLTILDNGEFGFRIKNRELVIGSQASNIQMGTDEIGVHSNQVDHINKGVNKFLSVDSKGKFVFVDKPISVPSLGRSSDHLALTIPLIENVLKYNKGVWKPAGVGELYD
jgi:hypothetical protein